MDYSKICMCRLQDNDVPVRRILGYIRSINTHASPHKGHSMAQGLGLSFAKTLFARTGCKYAYYFSKGTYQIRDPKGNVSELI